MCKHHVILHCRARTDFSMGVCVPEPRICHGYKEWLCFKISHSLASFLWSVPLHTLQNPSPMKATSLAGSRSPTLEASVGELARATLSFQRYRCSFDARQPTSSFLRPLVSEPSSSLQHGHLLLHLLLACSVSPSQTCQQSSQPGAGSICQ